MGDAAISLVTLLSEAGKIDTVYRDVYLDRARAALAPVLSLDEYHRLDRERAALADVRLAAARALDRADWSLVKELSQRAQALKQAIQDNAALVQAGRAVYDVADVLLDPFSPGLQTFTRIPRRELATLRTRVLDALGTLQASDVAWKDFYAARSRAFQALPATFTEAEAATASPADALAAARQALNADDMARLAALADVVTKVGAPAASRSPHADEVTPAGAERESHQGLEVRYSAETLARARQLGLAPRHLEPRTEIASLRRYAWTPLSDASRTSVAPSGVRLPSGYPEGLREGLEIFMIHPLVSSGGARYLPSLVAEDILVEDFPDPADGEIAPMSQLVKRLGLPGRRGLSRDAVEHALLLHGGRIVEDELGLDPRVFRLVCIPPDVYVRLGEAEGWGRQPFWTQFDGYLIRTVGGQVRLQALAGGDVRYGGLYEVLGVGREYDSDRLFARFAVVQRERMVAW